MSFAGNGAAFADTTNGDGSLGGGNQVNLPITVPINISGNAVGVVGTSEASSAGGATVVNDGGTSTSNNITSGSSSVIGGNQVNAPITAPINACGNAVAVIGSSDAGCKGNAVVKSNGKGGAGGNHSSGDESVIGGNQAIVPISSALNGCGNAVAIFGAATAGCKGGAQVYGAGSRAGGNQSSGDRSLIGGNQAVAPITVPANICGNAVGVIGQAFSGCKGGSSVVDGGSSGAATSKGGRPTAGSTGNDTDGRFAAGSGNQIVAPLTSAINGCGNAAAPIGQASAGCQGGAKVHGSDVGDNYTSGSRGLVSGNQGVVPITAPINVCGNAAELVGHAFAGCKGSAIVKNDSRATSGSQTSGQAGTLSGNQGVVPIKAPINVCGNAAAVLGDAAAGCLGGAKNGKPAYKQPNEPKHRTPKKPTPKHDDRKRGDRKHDDRKRDDYKKQPHAAERLSAGKTGLPSVLSGAATSGTLPGGGAFAMITQAVEGKVLNVASTTDKTTNTVQDTFEAVPVRHSAAAGAAAQDVAVPGQVQDAAGPVQDLTGGTASIVPLYEFVGGSPLDGVTKIVTDATMPLVDNAAEAAMPEQPELPGLPSQAQAPAVPAKPAKTKHAKAVMSSRADRGDAGRASSPISAATSLVSSTPVGGAVNSVGRNVKVRDIGLMSAAQPAGVTGMNSSSLLALVLGAMFAASATLFASARRFRLGRK